MLRTYFTSVLIFPLAYCQVVNETEIVHDRDLIDIDADLACKMQPDGFDCSGKGKFKPIFYYDILMQDCKTKYIGQCEHQFNTFSNLRDCSEACRDSSRLEVKGNISPKIYCRLQPDFGRCNSYHPMWYFDLTTRTCRGFSYSGCGGNVNRFTDHQECAAACSVYITF